LLASGLFALFWLLVGAIDSIWFYFLATMKGGPPSWQKIIIGNGPYWVAAAFLTPLVVWIARRLRVGVAPLWRIALIHLAGAIAFAAMHVALTRAVRSLFMDLPIWGLDFVIKVRKVVASTLDKEILVYLVIVGAVYIHDYYRRYREKERAAAALVLEQARLRALLSQAQLEALKMQLQPHFLFNALHAISTLIMRGDAPAANKMLLHLSRFLRMTLDSSESAEVPLAVELDFLDAYLSIQKERFGDRLRIDMRIDDDTREAAVPSLILQPLVENSIRHGIGADPGRGTIRIESTREGDRLRLRVTDDGSGLGEEGPPSEGVGLANIRARLEQLYPDAHGFELGAAPGGGTEAVISLPFRVARTLPVDDTRDLPRPGEPEEESSS
jgi:signal transduction histidine kinase